MTVDLTANRLDVIKMLGLALPRPVAFAGCCIIAALNFRAVGSATMIEDRGFQNAAFILFETSAVILFAMYAAWTIARSPEAREPYRSGDAFVLAMVVIAILLPLQLPALCAGFAAGVWLLCTSRSGTACWRVAIILTAIAAQQIFGRVFLALFTEIILAADIFLVGLAGKVESYGNVLARPDGSDLIITAGCSSIRNLSYALLAWVTVGQLFRMRLDKRLASYVLTSLVAIFLLNSLRILSMAWFPEHFFFLHEGGGAALFGWTGFLILAGLAGAAVLDIVPRQRRV